MAKVKMTKPQEMRWVKISKTEHDILKRKYREEIDGTKRAKPVGYRFTNEGAIKLKVGKFDKPTKEQIKKYAPKGLVYRETRANKSDASLTKKK